ncbi:MAG: hypothetical protein KF892_07435 [Rhizobacter sp.]|nr:hypothetical protein [Rhizobacter sp.]
MKTLFAAAGLLALAACTSYGPRSIAPGTSVDAVRQSLGVPTGEFAQPDGGRRLEYARGPYGRHTYMLDFDAGGKLLRWEQVLTEAKFNSIQPGMTGAEVQALIGHSFDQRMVGVAERRQTVWAYRYETPFCQYFQVGIDSQGKVMDTSYGPDPLCETRETSDGL